MENEEPEKNAANEGLKENAADEGLKENVANEEPMKNVEDEEPQKSAGSRKWFLWVGVGVLACVAIGLVLYFFHIRSSKQPAPVEKITPRPVVKETPPLPPPPKVVKEEEKKTLPLTLPKLGQSDEGIREKAKGLSLNPMLADWLRANNIIRRITAAVDSIAEGQSPRASLKFLAPQKDFSVQKKGEKLYINPKSYTRYNLAVDVFESLSAEGIVRVFKEFKPLFQEAYRELGYRDRDFQDTLIRAIKELLRAPVVKSDILLEEGGEKAVSSVAATMADEKLEDLSDAQKHLLRMGPKNTAKIQGKLREIAQALGVPENQLPKSRVFYSKVK
jgi:hypothetical protein